MDNYLTRREKIGITDTERLCLWLGDAQRSLVRSSSLLRARLETTRNFRLGSNRPPPRERAAAAGQFGENLRLFRRKGRLAASSVLNGEWNFSSQDQPWLASEPHGQARVDLEGYDVTVAVDVRGVGERRETCLT